jgi:hypothetical protein
MLSELLFGTLHWAVMDPLVGLLFGLTLVPLALPFRFFRATSTPVVAVGLPGLACFAGGVYLHWQHNIGDMEHIQHLIFVYWIAGLFASLFIYVGMPGIGQQVSLSTPSLSSSRSLSFR